MFTRDSNKVRLVVLSILTLAAIYSGSSLVLHSIASWAEGENDTYPFQGGESPLRYLLPTVFASSRESRILLTGSSDAGNALVPADFGQAFKDYKVLHAPIPMATLDDILLSLEYIEKVYGFRALPEILVLGLTLRVVANQPRRFGPGRQANTAAFLFEAINKYSPHYHVRSSATGSYLEAKSLFEQVVAQMRFRLNKQQPRYRAGLVSAFERLVNGVRFNAQVDSGLPYISDIRAPLAKEDLPAALNYIREVGFLPALRLWLRICKAPYTFHQVKPSSLDEIRAKLEARQGLYEWDPRQESAMVVRNIRELVARCDRHGVKLYVVNLPEHPLNRDRYNNDYYESYRALVKEALGDRVFLDLRDDYGSEFFVDQEHVGLPGARTVSRRVVEFIKADLNQAVTGDRGGKKALLNEVTASVP